MNLKLINENINYYIKNYFNFLDSSAKQILINYLEDKSNFNEEFYKNKYDDLLFVKDYYEHFIYCGLKEGRLCSEDHEKMCKEFNQIALNRLIVYNKGVKIYNHDTIFTILIRTSNRPNEFKRCLKSIYEQNYPNICLVISYDNANTLKYIQSENIKLDYKTIDLTKMNYIKKKCHYNLYCNELLKHVNNGWCFFLDDDDEIICPNTLHKLNNEIILNEIESDNLLIFHNYRDDKILKIKDRENPKVGEVAISSFVFHSKYKNNSNFTTSSSGDFDFFINMFYKLKRWFFEYPIVKINNYT
jgi:hypothetical protein